MSSLSVLAVWIVFAPATLLRVWFPTSVGDRWVYEVELHTGTRTHPEIERWTEEVQIDGVEEVANGMMIRRSVTALTHEEVARHDPSWRPEADVLVHNGCLYFDVTQGELSQTLPDVCPPLQPGKTWGNPKKGRFLWKVAGYGSKDGGDPDSVTPQSVRLEAHLASGDDNYVWLQKGVGVVGLRTIHNGTYFDYRVRLVGFRPVH